MGKDSHERNSGIDWRMVGVAVLSAWVALTVHHCSEVASSPTFDSGLSETITSVTVAATETSIGTAPIESRRETPVPPEITAEAVTVIESPGTRTVTATGYCSCATCCGKSDGVTASDTSCHWGTIAAPRGWAFGSRYTIEGLSGVFTVEDRSGSISGNRIDIWFPTHAEALAWGRRTVTLTEVE